MLQAKYKLAIVDDHPVVLEGLVNLISRRPAFDISGAFVTGQDFLRFFENNRVDIVLLDIILPDLTGMDICKAVKSFSPDTVVLVLSNHEERSVIMKMIAQGASGYLLKNTPVGELMDCIQAALEGQIVFSQAVRDIISRPDLTPSGPEAVLTAREREILRLIAGGITTRKIAEQLFLSKFTVENHRKNLLQKFGVKNVAELISTASRQGYL